MKYILNEEGQPVPEPDFLKWSMRGLRGLWRDSVNGFTISTVFLGLDHSFLPGSSRPLLFETMIYGGPKGGFLDFQKRYSTREEAIIGHNWALENLERIVQEESIHG